jgi:hypothetical protein
LNTAPVLFDPQHSSKYNIGTDALPSAALLMVMMMWFHWALVVFF